MVNLNHYSGSAINRAAERRQDRAWIDARLNDPATRVVPVWRGHSLVAEGSSAGAVMLSGREMADLLSRPGAEPILLGTDARGAIFALDVSLLDEGDAGALGGDGRFMELYGIATQLMRDEASLLSHAAWLVHWAQKHRHCGTCGAPTVAADAGHVRCCSDPACGAFHFPRTDPAVIVLVEHDGRCLLAHQKGWPGRLHSCLAGFVEPGEAAEEAVAREVLEESGVTVRDISFHATQPWPYPCSLMIGFYARTDDPTLDLGDDELEEAGWYSREDLRAEDLDIQLPRHDSIARRLIEDWLAQG